MGQTTGGGGYDGSKRDEPDAGEIGDSIQQTVLGGDEVDRECERISESAGITDQQMRDLADRSEGIQELLNDNLAVVDSSMIGSVTRDTVTGPMSPDTDTDVLIELDASEHPEWIESNNGPRNCLRAVKRRLQEAPRFSDTDIEIDQNAVRVNYSDSSVEVVPAFRYEDVPHAEDPGRNESRAASDGYAIPDTRSTILAGNQSSCIQATVRSPRRSEGRESIRPLQNGEVLERDE